LFFSEAHIVLDQPTHATQGKRSRIPDSSNLFAAIESARRVAGTL